MNHTLQHRSFSELRMGAKLPDLANKDDWVAWLQHAGPFLSLNDRLSVPETDLCAGVIGGSREGLAEEDGSRTHLGPSDGPTRF